MASDDGPDASAVTGTLSTKPEQIARVLDALMRRDEPVICDPGAPAPHFVSRVIAIDAQRAWMMLAASSDEAANKAVLARARCTFRGSVSGWQFEFTARDPQRVQYDGKAAVRFRFPEILAGRQRRATDRVAAREATPLPCVLDAEGFTPFEAMLVDVSEGGVAFFTYATNINLEPGTLLKGCHFELPSGRSLTVDMEVRYSDIVTRADGSQVLRSGCRFLLAPEATGKVLARLAAELRRAGMPN